MKLIVILLFLALINRTESATAAQNNLILLSEEGFSPFEISIVTGDSVTFTNNGAEDHWPASNIHPTHGIYPEFDPGKPLAPGESWSFTFEEVGKWGMHDHLSPENTGRIIVNGEKREALKNSGWDWKQGLFNLKVGLYKFVPFLKASYYQENNFMQVASKEDSEKILFIAKVFGQTEVAQKLLEETKTKRGNCHNSAHQFGQAFYKLEGRDFFKKVDFGCHSGFLHGGMEEYLKQQTAEDFALELEELCHENFSDYKISECLHGIGHGVMVAADYDLPLAISQCDKLYDNNRASCYAGMFMENTDTALGVGGGSPHRVRSLNDSPSFPCSQLENKEGLKFQCFENQIAWMYKLFSRDYQKITEECKKIADSSRAGCFRGIGRHATNTMDPKVILQRCGGSKETGKNEDYEECLLGSLNVIMYSLGERLKDEPHRLCSEVDSEYQSFCFGLIADIASNIFRNNSQKERKMCDYSKPEFMEQCRKITETY